MSPPHRIRKHHRDFRFLMDFWSRYCRLDEFHVNWALQHLHIVCLRKNETVCLSGERQQYLYLVTAGILARTAYNPPIYRRKIFSVALPGMALMTTSHPYSATPNIGDIIALRPKTSALRIPYRSFTDTDPLDPGIHTLIDVLNNKKRKQVSQMLRITLGNSAFDRCILLARENPTLFHTLHQQEIADMLQVSKSTVQSGVYYLAYNRKRKGN